MNVKLLRIAFTLFFVLFAHVLFADDAKPALDERISYQTECDTQWRTDQQGRHRHVGRAVCACYADALMQYKTDHHSDADFNNNFSSYKKQASQFCVTGGVFDNSIQLAVFERIYDKPSIEGICNSFWVGLMRTFKPADPKFNSKKICECASDEMTSLAKTFDTLPPQELRAQSLGLVKRCDPTSSLTSEQFAAIEKSLKKDEPMPPSDKGKFILEIKDDKNPDYQKIADYLREYKGLNTIVDAMNQTLKIPYDIHIVTTTTGSGPYYTYDNKTISLDYELMSVVLMLFDKYHPKESKQNRTYYFNNLNRFFLYHELGHALIDAYDLPVLGQEEDGADALSAVIALKYIPLGYHVMVDAADFFKLLDKVIGTEESSYWDEHALNEQRYYRLLCYAYGKSPRETEEKVNYYYKSDLKEFLKDRADYCTDEYHTTYQDWMRLLQPYFKTQSTSK